MLILLACISVIGVVLCFIFMLYWGISSRYKKRNLSIVYLVGADSVITLILFTTALKGSPLGYNIAIWLGWIILTGWAIIWIWDAVRDARAKKALNHSQSPPNRLSFIRRVNVSVQAKLKAWRQSWQNSLALFLQKSWRNNESIVVLNSVAETKL